MGSGLTEFYEFNTTTYHSSSGARVFYSEEEERAWQIADAEAKWRRKTPAERLQWWSQAVIFGYSSVPTYGAWASLYGVPGWIPGTRIPFKHKLRPSTLKKSMRK